MTRRDLAAGAFLVAGLYAWVVLAGGVAENVVSVGSRANAFYGMTHSEYLKFVRGSLFVQAFPLCLVFAAGYALIFRARSFAHRLFPEESAGEAAVVVTGNTRAGYAVAIALLGLYLAVGAAPALVSNLIRLASYISQPQAQWWTGLAGGALTDTAGTLVRLILGGILFFKAAAITAQWHDRKEREQVPSQP